MYKFVQSGGEHVVFAPATGDAGADLGHAAGADLGHAAGADLGHAAGADLGHAAGASESDQSVGTDPSPLPA